jgi:hypothetical protein
MKWDVLDVAPLAQEADIWLHWLSVALVHTNRAEDSRAIEQLREQLRARVNEILPGAFA